MATTTGPDSAEAPVLVGATRLHGIGVGRGGVVGPVAQVRPVPQVAADAAVLIDGVPAGPDEVRGAVGAAFGEVADRLRRESERAPGVLGGVLAATAEMAADPALRAKVLSRMDDGDGAVGAITIVVAEFAAMFEQAGGYLAERVTDLRSVRDRVIAEIVGLPAPGVPHLTEPSVVVALDLAPADTAALDLSMVLAIVTEQGGPTGHTAIIARQLGLPCVVQTAGATELADGVVVAVDASAGIVTVEPGDELRREFDQRRRLEQSFASDVAPGASSDGAPVGLLANIGTAADAARLTDTAVEGVLRAAQTAVRPELADELEPLRGIVPLGYFVPHVEHEHGVGDGLFIRAPHPCVVAVRPKPAAGDPGLIEHRKMCDSGLHLAIRAFEPDQDAPQPVAAYKVPRAVNRVDDPLPARA